MPDDRHGDGPALAGGTDHPVRRYRRAVEEHLAEFVRDAVHHPQWTLLHARLFHLEDEC